MYWLQYAWQWHHPVLLMHFQVAAPTVPGGTQDFLSPEVLASINGGSHSTYGVECDWWSLGVIAYEMIYARLPFSGSTSTKTIHNILNFQVLSSRLVPTLVTGIWSEMVCCRLPIYHFQCSQWKYAVWFTWSITWSVYASCNKSLSMFFAPSVSLSFQRSRGPVSSL